jgi:hypothetical protein
MVMLRTPIGYLSNTQELMEAAGERLDKRWEVRP